ncbi:MAG: hypothetical protein QOF82_267 [Frankiales bacterium]|jgi:hypothetical protein|nr:hypothetical protein [Frankiales bacterium]MDX6211180.1 hypothetical protein [Frankiales bacterium]
MTRTTAAALALGSALTLAACTGGSSTATPAGGTSTSGSSAPATSAAPTSASSSGQPSGTPSASSAPATAVAPSTTAAATVPATATSPGATPTTTATGASTRCRNSQLRVTLGTPDRGAGQIYTQILFVNSGSTTCTLAGHPGVSYVAGDDGHQVGASATRTGTAITTVSLKPGGTASALLHETNYANFDQSVCKPVTVRGLRVYPPGSTAAVFIARAGKQCSATTLPDPAMSIAVVKAGNGS